MYKGYEEKLFYNLEPPSPFNVTTVNKTTTSITLQWFCTQSDPVDEFEININTTSINYNKTTTANVYVVNDLHPCQKYSFAIFAINKAGKSKSSKKTVATTKPSKCCK